MRLFKISIIVALLCLFDFGNVIAHDHVCHLPMNNVPIPSMHIEQHHQCLPHNVWPQPGLYWSEPGHRYPFVPLVQAQERIYVDIVTAEGLNISDGRSRRVQFYIGTCADGQIWCQPGASPGRFQSEDDAYRFVERIFALRDFSLREMYRRTNGTQWYIN
ncbi:MAG: hypothetical protein HY226_04290 [Candidatus Vogelbacteria bacterium]|nr:hypothetical protein [Candidatus Vogelbacteria bacterium]